MKQKQQVTEILTSLNNQLFSLKSGVKTQEIKNQEDLFKRIDYIMKQIERLLDMISIEQSQY